MAKPKKRKTRTQQERYAGMRRRGVPEAFLDEVSRWGQGRRKKPEPERESFLERWAGVGAMIVCLVLYQLLKYVVTSQAVREAAASGAWLVAVDVNAGGFGILIAILALLFWAALRFGREEDKLQGAADLVRGHSRAWTGYARWMASGVTGSDARAFLAGIDRQVTRRIGGALLGLAALMAGVVAAELRHFTVVDARGVVHHRLFPPFTSTSATWDQTRLVTQKCVRSGGRRHRGPIKLKYVFHFDNGLEVDLGDGIGIQDSRLGVLEEITRRLPLSTERKTIESSYRCQGVILWQQPYL